MRKNIDISDPAFRERFHHLRDRANLTQTELAAKAGVAPKTVHNVEGAVLGKAQEKTLRLLAAALDVGYEQLLYGPAAREPDGAREAPTAPADSSRRRRLSTPFLAIVIALAVLAGGFALNKWIPPPPGTGDAPAISVICFENLADPADPARLGMIVSDLIVNELAESRLVRVVSHAEMEDRGSGSHLEAARKSAVAAGVDWLLVGSIIQEKPRFVLRGQIESTHDGTVMATQTVTAAEGETVFDVAAHLAARAKSDLVRNGAEGAESGLPIAHVTTRSVKAYRHYVEGMENLKKLYREEARNQLRLAVADDSTFAMAMIMLVHPEIAGPPAERDSLVARAQRFADKLTLRERYYLDMFSAWSRHDLDGAIATCEALIRDYPQETEGYRMLGRLYNTRREPARAIAALETAVEVDPFDGMSLNRLGYMYAGRGDFKRAMDCVDRYVRLKPSEANPYDTRGDFLAWSGRPDEAIASYKAALERNPRFFPSMQSLGVVLTLTGRYDEAERYYRMMLGSEDKGARARGRWMLAMVQVYRGSLELAEATLRQALAADDFELDRSSAYEQKLCAIAAIQAERGDVHDAISTYVAALDTHQVYYPGANSADWTVGHVALLSRVDLDAARAARDALEERTREVWGDKRGYGVNACNGWIQLRSGDAAAACASFEKAVADVDVFQYRYPLALAYIEAGRAEDAIRVLEYAVNRYSSDRILNAIWGVKMYYQLGRAYELAGRPDEARAMYTRFLDMWGGADPTFEEIGEAQQHLAALDQNL